MTSESELELNSDTDIQALASTFKLWLRDLVDGVIPKRYFVKLMDTLGNVEEMQKAVESMPNSNYFTLEYICRFLVAMAQKADVNRMNSTNLSIVFGPCLIKIMAADDQIEQGMKETMKTSDIIKQLIDNFDSIFQGFSQRESTTSASTPLQKGNMRVTISSPLLNDNKEDTVRTVTTATSLPKLFSKSVESATSSM